MRLRQKCIVSMGLICVIGGLLCAMPVVAEELRILVTQGSTTEQTIAEFEQMIQQKYQIELKLIVENWADPGEVYKALRNKTADIISCPHNFPKDPDFKLIAGKLTLPLDLQNIPNLANVIPAMQEADYITEGGQAYGVAYAYSPYGLAYNSALFSEPPTSWNVLWDPQYAGQYVLTSTMYELNILITELALGADRSQVGQLERAKTPEFQEKLRALAQNAGAFWTLTDTADDLQGKTLAAAWGYSFQELRNRGEEWRFAQPVEGVPSGIGVLMLGHSLRANPTLKKIAEEWLNYVISPDYQSNVILGAYFPVNLAIKDRFDPDTVAYYHLDDPNYAQEQMIPWPMLDKRTRTAFELFWNKATR